MWKRLRYRFDNWMARGVGAQMLLLAVITVVLVLITVAAIIVLDVVPENDKGEADSFGVLTWKSLMRALDPGTLAGDTGTWTLLFIFLFATIGGLFVLSALIGIINQAFGSSIESLRRGKSVVIERDHTVILGWGPKIFTLLHELAEANANQRGACIVVLADRDKVEMDAAIAVALRGKRLRVVTRRGSTMAMADLALVGLATSKAVVVLAPEHDATGAPLAPNESDTVVLKTLLALTKVSAGHRLHIVAELIDERSEAVARMVVGESASLILAAPLISRLLVQTGRQPGLSVVYTELLDFAGVEIYVAPQPALVGKTFREAVFAHDTSTVIGLLNVAGNAVLSPPAETRLTPDDQLIAISEDDDTIVLDGRPVQIDEATIMPVPPSRARVPENTLVLGASPRLAMVLAELDSYVAPGSRALVVGEGNGPSPAELVLISRISALRNMAITSRSGDVTERGLLESLEVASFDHILVLSETAGRTQEMADARTTVTLLHLRDLARRAGKKVPITSEILDIQSRDLATVAEADDFIVSNTLVSLMVSQVAENAHLVRVFDELFSAGGVELYLKPAADYVRPGTLPFAAVCEAALRRGQVAIGYRLAASANDPEAGFGVTINPAKRSMIELTAVDKVIVLAED